jgi:hypothetical protein
MKLFRMKTLATFGIGFLAGSAAGRGPWEKTQASMEELKDKVSGSMNGGQYGTMPSNGIEGQHGGQGKPAMTEM